jgi:hypothetical protein
VTFTLFSPHSVSRFSTLPFFVFSAKSPSSFPCSHRTRYPVLAKLTVWFPTVMFSVFSPHRYPVLTELADRYVHRVLDNLTIQFSLNSLSGSRQSLSTCSGQTRYPRSHRTHCPVPNGHVPGVLDELAIQFSPSLLSGSQHSPSTCSRYTRYPVLDTCILCVLGELAIQFLLNLL